MGCPVNYGNEYHAIISYYDAVNLNLPCDLYYFDEITKWPTWFDIYIDYCSISVGKHIIPAIVYGFNQKTGFFNSGLASSSKKTE